MYSCYYLEYNDTNWSVKCLLIESFADKVYFTYQRNSRYFRIFFFASTFSQDVVENLFSKDPIKLCAAKLQKEFEVLDFLCDVSYWIAQDVNINLEQYKNNYFEPCETFFQHIKPISDKILTQKIPWKTDLIFPIIFNLIHNVKRKTPMHVTLSEAIYDTCLSKKLIRIMNHLGLCTSDNTVERIDTALVQRTIDMARSYLCTSPTLNCPSWTRTLSDGQFWSQRKHSIWLQDYPNVISKH